MNVTEIQRVSFNVDNLDESVKFWKEHLGLNFPPKSHDPVELRKKLGKITHTYSEWADESERARPIAKVSTAGIELMHKDPMPGPEGIRGIILTVDDIEEAKARMAAKGIRFLHEISSERGGGEVFYHPEDLHGVRVTLCQGKRSLEDSEASKAKTENQGFEVLGIQRVALGVNNRDESAKFWTDLLGLDFPPLSHDPAKIREMGEVTHTYTEWATERDKSRPHAVTSPIGLEIMQKEPLPVKEGIMWLVLTVDNMEAAKARMAAKGIRWVHEITVGTVFDEVFYHPDDCHGVPLVLSTPRIKWEEKG